MQQDLFYDVKIERDCEAAMARLIAWIDCSCGQHFRRWLEKWGYR